MLSQHTVQRLTLHAYWRSVEMVYPWNLLMSLMLLQMLQAGLVLLQRGIVCLQMRQSTRSGSGWVVLRGRCRSHCSHHAAVTGGHAVQMGTAVNTGRGNCSIECNCRTGHFSMKWHNGGHWAIRRGSPKQLSTFEGRNEQSFVCQTISILKFYLLNLK